MYNYRRPLSYSMMCNKSDSDGVEIICIHGDDGSDVVDVGQKYPGFWDSSSEQESPSRLTLSIRDSEWTEERDDPICGDRL